MYFKKKILKKITFTTLLNTRLKHMGTSWYTTLECTTFIY
jgi:hypothetical protein